MKKTILFVAIAIVLIMAMGKLQQYTIKGTVVEDRGNTIIVEDITGKQWEVCVEAFTYSEGDTITLVMNDYGTTNRQDDKVINIK